MWERLLEQALKTARRLGPDPEHESIAGFAVMTAVETYDPSKGVSLEQWTSYVVRTRVWSYWRTLRCRPIEYRDVEPTCADETPTETHPDWELLVERYINGVAEWALARRHGVTTYTMHKRINAAKARFLEYMGA